MRAAGRQFKKPLIFIFSILIYSVFNFSGPLDDDAPSHFDDAPTENDFKRLRTRRGRTK